MQKIVPNLWLDTEAEEAADFYVSVFDNSRVVNVAHYTEAGPRPAGMVMTVEFELDGERFVAINGGDQFKFDEAVSFQISCENQEEIDYFWERLTDGGEEASCGWLKDKYGLSWQVTPSGMEELSAAAYPERAERARGGRCFKKCASSTSRRCNTRPRTAPQRPLRRRSRPRRDAARQSS